METQLLYPFLNALHKISRAIFFDHNALTESSLFWKVKLFISLKCFYLDETRSDSLLISGPRTTLKSNNKYWEVGFYIRNKYHITFTSLYLKHVCAEEQIRRESFLAVNKLCKLATESYVICNLGHFFFGRFLDDKELWFFIIVGIFSRIFKTKFCTIFLWPFSFSMRR